MMSDCLFCGHATIAGVAVIGERFGTGTYKLFLKKGDEINVEVEKSENNSFSVALRSPETWSETAPKKYVDNILTLFNLNCINLDPKFPVRFAFAGAKHLIIVLKDKKTLSEMDYQFESVKVLMLKQEIATISLLWPESDELFHARNAFASGGVFEDPATGAAAAAFAGYLRDINWQGQKSFEILQGEDMGCPSRLFVQYTTKKGEGIKVSGETRYITENNS